MAVLFWSRHKYYVCRVDGGSRCEGCVYCEGGLAFCVVCQTGEGQIPTDCPGYPIGEFLADEVCAGRLDYTRRQGWINTERKVRGSETR